MIKELLDILFKTNDDVESTKQTNKILNEQVFWEAVEKIEIEFKKKERKPRKKTVHPDGL